MGQQRASASLAPRRATRTTTAPAALREVLLELETTYPAMMLLDEARMFLRLTDWQVRRLISKGELHAFRQGGGRQGRFMVARSEVRRFLEEAA